jgi:DNA invertase Pin-like site-specific DNA recombinase
MNWVFDMIVGYARTSTVEQVAGFDSQVRELQSIDAKKIFKEQVSSVASRSQLGAAIDYCREGDVLCVTKLDRLARSVRDLCRIIDTLKAKDVGLRILNMNFDTATPTGKMMLTILGSIAEFEREIMLERQKEGIAKAQSEGKYRGRAPTARAKTDQVFALDRAGKTREAIAKEVGISLVSVYRILRTRNDAEKAPLAPPVTRVSTGSQVSA